MHQKKRINFRKDMSPFATKQRTGDNCGEYASLSDKADFYIWLGKWPASELGGVLMNFSALLLPGPCHDPRGSHPTTVAESDLPSWERRVASVIRSRNAPEGCRGQRECFVPESARRRGLSGYSFRVSIEQGHRDRAPAD